MRGLCILVNLNVNQVKTYEPILKGYNQVRPDVCPQIKCIFKPPKTPKTDKTEVTKSHIFTKL
jgi:hypothetical protein